MSDINETVLDEQKLENVTVNCDEGDDLKSDAVLEVTDIPADDPSDISTEESVKIYSPNDEKIKKISDEQKEYLLKRAKECEIEWDKVDFEEDGITPKVTKEEIEIFAAIASEFFDYDTISIYIDQSKFAIDEYLEIKQIVDSGEADDDTLDHYKLCCEGYEDARIVLAMLQQESRKLETEFKESKIAEDFLKSITLKTLRDYMVERFKLNKSWYNPENKPMSELDSTKEIEESMMKNLYVTTMFSKMIERYSYKSKNSLQYNIHGEKFLSDSNKYFITGLQSYLNNLTSKDNIDIKTVITRDFRTLDFINATVLYPLIYHGDGIVSEMSLSAEDKELFVKKLDPNGYFTTEDADKIYDKSYKLITEIIDSLMDVSNVERVLQITRDIVKHDPMHNKIFKSVDIDIDNYTAYISQIAKFFPTIEDLKVMNWGKVYTYMNKYETYITYVKLYNVISDPSHSEVEKRRAGFNTLKSVLGTLYMTMYGEYITTLNDYIKENVYSKEPRSTIFGITVRNMIMQHELGFKAEFIPNDNDSGEKLYETAKKSFGKDYDTIIGTEQDDILLKNVNLTSVRKNYVCTLNDMLELIKNDYLNIFNDSYIRYLNAMSK
jgi:hypothetical protein